MYIYIYIYICIYILFLMEVCLFFLMFSFDSALTRRHDMQQKQFCMLGAESCSSGAGVFSLGRNRLTR